VSDLGDLARQSLMAIDAWTQNINANMVGANKIAYKNTRISFGAGISNIDRPPSGGQIGIQTTQPSLTVQQTSVEFVAGSIVTNTQATDFAIQDRQNSPGTNFFVLQDPNDATKFYLSRDGEFHFGTATVQMTNPANPAGPRQSVSGTFLMNTYGLIVIGSGNTGYAGTTVGVDDGTNGGDIKLAYGSAALALKGNFSTASGANPDKNVDAPARVAPAQYGSFITQDATTTDPFDDPTTSSLNTPDDPKDGQRATGLTYVNNTLPPPAGSQQGFAIHNWPTVVNIKNPQNLIFSQYGSTIFNFAIQNTSGQPTTFNPTGTDSWDFDATGTGARPADATSVPPGSTSVYTDPKTGIVSATPSYPPNYVGVGPYADRQQNALEQSNASVTTLIPELTLAQKMFTAVSKLITIYGEDIDTLNNLIR